MWSFIHRLISPKKFFHLSSALLPWGSLAFFIFLAYGLVGGLYLAPADAVQGEGFRIIYVHVPCAFLSLFVYAVMAYASIATLVWQIKLAPLVLKHSAPIGATFTVLALITGSLWGKPMWGTWWLWDARLTSELILLFLYLAIIILQGAVATKNNGHTMTAIFTLVGFVDIPIIHYSVNWWNTLHQGSTLKLFAASSIDSSMLYPLLAMIAAFLLYYAIILTLRLRIELIGVQANQHWLQET